MDINQIREPLTDFFQKVSKEIKVDQVIVFGSYSTETTTEESDIDVVVVVSEDFKNLRSDKRLKILDEAAAFIRPKIVAARFTKKKLERASKFSIVGQARDQGIKFSGGLSVIADNESRGEITLTRCCTSFIVRHRVSSNS